MKTLSRFLVALVAVLLVGAPPLAAASYSTALNAVTTGTASTIIPSAGASNIEVYLRSTAGSTSTVTIELCATNAVASCYIVVTKSNVAAAGAWYSGPSGPFFRVNASAVSAGAVTALYGMNNAARLATWNDVKVPVASGAGVLAITDVNATGTVTGATLASTGGVTAATTVAATGGVSGTTGTFSGAVAGTTGTFSGAVAGTTGTFSGAISGTTVTGSGAIGGTTGTFSALTATRIPYNGVAGLLSDVANFTYTTATGALVNTNGTAPSISTARFLSTGTAPTVTGGASTCGTTAASIVGKDQAGKVTVGSVGGTACVVTFNVAFANAPSCHVTSATAVDVHAVSTTTTLTTTATFGAGEVFMYQCFSY
jgi:hypothetical protein